VPKVESSPVELKIRVSDSVLVLGQVDTINVVIKNLLGAVVLSPPGSSQCAALNSQLTVPASDSVVRTYYWTGGQSLFPPDPSAKLPVGQYFVSASLLATNYSVDAFPVGIRLATSR